MKIPEPENENYAATVVTIKNKIPLDNLDKLVHTNIFGNYVLVSSDTEIGEKGLFFPVECKLSPEFLSNNNLYRHSDHNADKTQKGFFEDNGRVKALKLKQNISQGFFIPLYALNYISDLDLEEGTTFDRIGEHRICEKYVVKRKQSGSPKKGKKPKVSRLVNNQFRFHPDTSQLGKNHYKLYPSMPIQATVKLHGTSAISSRVLCKKKLNPFLKLLKKCKVPVEDTYYDNIYSSRKVVKNDDINTGFYGEDIWGEANDILKPFLDDGMTIYYEIAGFLKSGGYIQKPYDYGCDVNNPYKPRFRIFIYRITYTNPSGQIFEFTPDQIQMWVESIQRDNDLPNVSVVPEEFEGRAEDILKESDGDYGLELIEVMKTYFNLEDDCWICQNKLPREGIVVRFLDRPWFEAYKLKGFRFQQKETEMIDKGQEDMEENN